MIDEGTGESPVGPLAAVSDLDDGALDITVERTARGTCVRVDGEIDLATADRLSTLLQGELVNRPAVLVVDLDGTTFFSSTALTTLALAQRAARRTGSEIRLVANRGIVLRPLSITGLADEIAVFTSVPDALAGRDGSRPAPP